MSSVRPVCFELMAMSPSAVRSRPFPAAHPLLRDDRIEENLASLRKVKHSELAVAGKFWDVQGKEFCGTGHIGVILNATNAIDTENPPMLIKDGPSARAASQGDGGPEVGPRHQHGVPRSVTVLKHLARIVACDEGRRPALLEDAVTLRIRECANG